MDREISNTEVERTVTTIPYVVFESTQARNERHIKRLLVIIAVLICLLFASNAIWLTVYSSYDYSDYEVTSDGNSNANFIGGAVKGDIKLEGDINNGGKDKSENTDETNGSTGQDNPDQS